MLYNLKGQPINLKNTFVKGVAHRGAKARAPENTMHAFKKALLYGFSFVECDVQFTSDNVPVLLHDNTIDRTSDGTGNISEMTYAEVSQYDFGSWFSGDYANTKIVTLEEFVSFCRNTGLHPYIELKECTEEQAISCVDLVKKYGMRDNVTFISFWHTTLAHIKNYDGKIRLGYVVEGVATSNLTTAQGLKTDTNEVFIDSSVYSDDMVQMCIDADMPLEVWTVQNQKQMLELNPYITGVTSDYYDFANVLLQNELK